MSSNRAGRRTNDIDDLSDAETQSIASDSRTQTKKRATRNSKPATSRSTAEQEQALSFYSEDWAAVLYEAQLRWHRYLILGRVHPFPERSTDLHEAHKVLTAVISEHLNDGFLLNDSK